MAYRPPRHARPALAGHIRSPGNRLACFTPEGEPGFVELVLVDVEVMHFRVLGLAGRD